MEPQAPESGAIEGGVVAAQKRERVQMLALSGEHQLANEELGGRSRVYRAPRYRLAAFLGWVNSQHMNCFAHFDTRQAADRAASAAREAGYDANVEPSGPKEHQPTSEGGRRIGVTFSDGETGDDASEFRRTVAEVVRREEDTFPPTVWATGA